MVVHKASFYRWYANTRISCGKNRNTLVLRPINAQSYQGTRVVRASSLRNTAGQRSRWSSVFTGGNDCCRASRIWSSSCSVISILFFPSAPDSEVVQVLAQDANRAEDTQLHRTD